MNTTMDTLTLDFKLITVPQTQIPEMKISNSTLNAEPQKTPEKQKIVRLSASKKYAGQIMVGVAKHALTLLQNSQNPIHKLIIEIIWRDFLGKNKEDYKMNKVEKIRTYFIIEEKDSLITREIKKGFMLLVASFFVDNNYNHWVNKEFKGTEDNKEWYRVNKIPLMDRIIYNKKTHFYQDAKSNPFLMNNLTMKDNVVKHELEADTQKKVKVE